LTVTPAPALVLLARRKVREARTPRLVSALQRGYSALLRPLLRHPWPIVGVAVLLLVAALAAIYLPARRATKVSPANALRATE